VVAPSLANRTRRRSARPREVEDLYDALGCHDLPRLDARAEADLANCARAGDRSARDRLVLSNVGLVASAALKFRPGELDLDDMLAEGLTGLVQAADRFDPAFGFRFSTLATHSIRNAILRAVLEKGSLVRVAASAEILARAFRVEAGRMRDELGREPREVEVAERLGVGPSARETVRLARAAWRCGKGAHLPRPFGEDDPASSVLPLLVDRREGPARSASREDLAAEVRRQVAKLPTRLAMIVRRRHGIGGGRAETLEEIAATMGITRERVRQLEAKAMERLTGWLGPLAGSGRRCGPGWGTD